MGQKVKEWTNPTNVNGEFLKQLKQLVTSKEEGLDESPINFSSEFQKKILDLLGSAVPGNDPDANKCEFYVQ